MAFDFATLVWFVLILIVGVCVAGLLWWLIGYVERQMTEAGAVPPKAFKIVRVIFVVLLVLFMIGLLLNLVGVPLQGPRVVH